MYAIRSYYGSLVKGLMSRNPLWRLGMSSRPNNRRPEFNEMMGELITEIDRESSPVDASK